MARCIFCYMCSMKDFGSQERKELVMSRLKACLLSCTTLFAMTLLFTSPTYAHIVNKPGVECHALLVHVYKNKPATTTCLLTEVQYQAHTHTPGSALSPYIRSGGGCSNGNALWLYLHVNSGGPCIGFIGNGTVYLTNYIIPTGGISWNDHVSSFFSWMFQGNLC